MREPKAKLTQILPSVRYMPKLSVKPKLAEALIDIVDRARIKNGKAAIGFEQSGQDIFPSIFAPERAQHAAEFYVSTKQYETALPEFRRTVDRRKKGSLAAVIAQLLEMVGDDNNPPFAQMRALFCSSDPAVDGFEKSAGDETEEQNEGNDPAYDDDSDQPEGIWRAKYSPEVLRTMLTQWLELMADLHQRAGGQSSAPGPTPIDAETNFVSWLAAYWVDDLELPLSSGRGEPKKKGANTHGQQGPFADFVKKAAEIIPAKPPGSRPHSLDRAIRKIIQAYKTKGDKT